MKRWGVGQMFAVLSVSVLFWTLIALACLFFGSTQVFAWPNATQLPFRFQEAILASIVGGALAAAGVVFQSILRNPLSDPYLLGISTGASLAAYVWTLPWAAPSFFQAIGQPACAAGGAVGAMVLVLALAQRRGRLEPLSLILVGVIINSICGAAYLFLVYVDRRRRVSGAELQFFVGGLRTDIAPWGIALAGLCFLAGWTVLWYLSGQLAVASLGQAEAESLGIGVQRLRWSALIVASLVTAVAVAVSGPIGFVGLICPHVARLIVGPDQRRLLPVATALGASLLAMADVGSRLMWNLPVGVFTAMLGGPFFLALLWRSRRGVVEG